MLIQEPGQSPYDLRFELLGFPVRVAWTFWAASLVFGYGLVQTLDNLLAVLSPGVLPLLLLWTACLFVSILIHELGHALAFRQNGIRASIVLYYLGGLAIPTGSYSSRGSGGLNPKQDIWVSFAGPLAQLLSAAVLGGVVVLMGYRLTVLEWMPGPFASIPGTLEGKELALDSPGLFALVTFYMFPSVLWALLNLIPVWPLDGGHIMRSSILLNGGNVVQALWVSVIVAGFMAFYGFSNGQQFLGFMFVMLGVSSYQAIDQIKGSRYG
ncbi:MAG: site-2 protease family protein [Rubripirellula sp.]|nr:site-2 protease family protein [Rubripirellula sp.]